MDGLTLCYNTHSRCQWANGRFTITIVMRTGAETYLNKCLTV